MNPNNQQMFGQRNALLQPSAPIMPPYRFPDWMLANLNTASLQPNFQFYAANSNPIPHQLFRNQESRQRPSAELSNQGSTSRSMSERERKCGSDSRHSPSRSTLNKRNSPLRSVSRQDRPLKRDDGVMKGSNQRGESSRIKRGRDEEERKEDTFKGTKRKLNSEELEVLAVVKKSRKETEGPSRGKAATSLPTTPVTDGRSPNNTPIAIRPNTANGRYHSRPSTSSHDSVPIYNVDSSSEEEELEREGEDDDESDDVGESDEKLSIDIFKYFEYNSQRDVDFNNKEQLRRLLENVIKNLIPDAMLFLVGSSLNGFGNRRSDADMCLFISEVQVDQKWKAQQVLIEINRCFWRACNFVVNPHVIFAKVPILRFTDRISQVECDINVNNLVGIRNTYLLFAYSRMDWRVVPLVMIIKQWAKASKIKDASQGTLSSYSLVLMVLHYLQVHCKPPVVPVIQQLDKTINARQSIYDVMHRLRSGTLPPSISFKSKNTSDLGTLFRGFFKYYSAFDFREKVMSLRLGVVCSLTPNWRKQYIHTEEPFELTNTARAVHTQLAFHQILSSFKNMNKRLQQCRDVNFDSIVDGVNSTPLGDGGSTPGNKRKLSKFAKERRRYQKTKKKLKNEQTEKALKWLENREKKSAAEKR